MSKFTFDNLQITATYTTNLIIAVEDLTAGRRFSGEFAEPYTYFENMYEQYEYLIDCLTAKRDVTVTTTLITVSIKVGIRVREIKFPLTETKTTDLDRVNMRIDALTSRLDDALTAIGYSNDLAAISLQKEIEASKTALMTDIRAALHPDYVLLPRTYVPIPCHLRELKLSSSANMRANNRVLFDNDIHMVPPHNMSFYHSNPLKSNSFIEKKVVPSQPTYDVYTNYTPTMLAYRNGKVYGPTYNSSRWNFEDNILSTNDNHNLTPINNIIKLEVQHNVDERGAYKEYRIETGDLSKLANFSDLESLEIVCDEVADISPLEELPLEHLKIKSTALRDVSIAAKLSLEVLDLAGCTNFSDLRPLIDHPTLKKLIITGTAVRNDLCLANNVGLTITK